MLICDVMFYKRTVLPRFNTYEDQFDRNKRRGKIVSNMEFTATEAGPHNLDKDGLYNDHSSYYFQQDICVKSRSGSSLGTVLTHELQRGISDPSLQTRIVEWLMLLSNFRTINSLLRTSTVSSAQAWWVSSWRWWLHPNAFYPSILHEMEISLAESAWWHAPCEILHVIKRRPCTCHLASTRPQALSTLDALSSTTS